MAGPSALDLSIGGLLIGVALNLWLYGFSVVQFYIYYSHFGRSDRLALRMFVLFLFVADTANAFFDFHFIYDYLVTNFGDMAYASVSNWSFTTDPAVTAIIACSCQTFFAWRVYRLTKSFAAPFLISIFSVASLLGGVATTIAVSIIPRFAEFQKFQVVVIIWLLGAALADTVITISLIWSLRKSKTGFQATDDLITKLIRTTIQTGALTTFFAVVDLILYLASNSTLHLIFNLPLAKLYVNSLLSTLNARTAISNVIYAVDGVGSSGQQRTANGTGTANRHSSFNPSSSAVDHKDIVTFGNGTAGPQAPQMSFLGGFARSAGLLNKLAPGNAATRKINRRSDSNASATDLEALGGSAAAGTGIHVHTVEERFEEKQANGSMSMSKSSSSLGTFGNGALPIVATTVTAGTGAANNALRPHSNSVGSNDTSLTEVDVQVKSNEDEEKPASRRSPL